MTSDDGNEAGGLFQQPANNQTKGGILMPIDPVCKMEIDKEDAGAETDYKGSKYYFCSEDCKESFDKAPEKYAEKKKKAAGEC